MARKPTAEKKTAEKTPAPKPTAEKTGTRGDSARTADIRVLGQRLTDAMLALHRSLDDFTMCLLLYNPAVMQAAKDSGVKVYD